MKSDKDTKILYIAKYAKMTEDLLKQSEHDRKFCERIIKQLHVYHDCIFYICVYE